MYLVCSAIGLWSIFTARRYAKRGTCRRRVSVRPSVRLQIMPHDRPGTQMGCFVVAEFILTSASRGPSAIAEFLVTNMAGTPIINSIDICAFCSIFEQHINRS